MSNFKRGKPKKQKGDSMGHKSELDPEPDPSRSGLAGNKKRQKKLWVVTGKDCKEFLRGNEGPRQRYIFGKYITEKQAIQAMEAFEKQDVSWRRLLKNWPEREYRIEYQGNENQST